MCYGCWEEAGKPQIDNARVRAAVSLIEDVYQHSCVGGNLHIVLDDWNVEDGNLEFCSQCIDAAGVMPLGENPPEFHVRFNSEKRKHPDPPDQLAAERACCDAFKAMSETERLSALALSDGYWDAPQNTDRT
jgi:hypothetical protein